MHPLFGRSPWLGVVVISVGLHAAIGVGLSMTTPDRPPPRIIVPVEVVAPPPQPKPKEEVVEPPKEEAKEEVVEEAPREAVVEPDPTPPPPTPPPKPPKPQPPPKAKAPPKAPRAPAPPSAEPPPATPPQATPPPAAEPPPLMGMSFEGTATAPPGQGIATPAGTREGAPHGRAGGQGDPKAPPAPRDHLDHRGGPGEPVVPVAGVTRLPVVLREAKADYPPEVKRQGVEGKVVVAVVVGTNGSVTQATLIDRLHPELDQAALRAARRLRFSPAEVDGRPVAVRIPYTFHFVID